MPNYSVSVWNIEFWQKTNKSNLAKRRYHHLYHEFCQKTFKLNLAKILLSRKWPLMIGLDFESFTSFGKIRSWSQSNILSCWRFNLPSIIQLVNLSLIYFGTLLYKIVSLCDILLCLNIASRCRRFMNYRVVRRISGLPGFVTLLSLIRFQPTVPRLVRVQPTVPPIFVSWWLAINMASVGVMVSSEVW